MTKTTMIRLLVVAVLIGLAPAAWGQCCGDCNADGTVQISELINGVGNALNGCGAAFQQQIALRGVRTPYFEAALDAPVSAGRLDLTLETDWAGSEESDRLLFSIRGENRFNGRVDLLKNGRFLRWVLTDDSGREVDLSVANDGWQPGVHSVSVSWGNGTTRLSVDGNPRGETSLGDLLLREGDDVSIGSPSMSGTVFRDVSLLTAPPAP